MIKCLLFIIYIHIWLFIVCTSVINCCLSIILTHFYIPVNIVRDLPWFINIFYRHVWNAILLRFCSNSVCNNFFRRHLQNILTLYVYIIIMQLFCNEVIILIKKTKQKWNAYSSDRLQHALLAQKKSTPTNLHFADETMQWWLIGIFFPD